MKDISRSLWRGASRCLARVLSKTKMLSIILAASRGVTGKSCARLYALNAPAVVEGMRPNEVWDEFDSKAAGAEKTRLTDQENRCATRSGVGPRKKHDPARTGPFSLETCASTSQSIRPFAGQARSISYIMITRKCPRTG
jgi:hypothetical protein